MNKKDEIMKKLKNKLEQVEWKSSFDFESFEIDEETKKFIELREEKIVNIFKKYSSSKYELCVSLAEVKTVLFEKGDSFMLWYQNLGFTKDKVSELLKTYELYIQAPHLKDYVSSLSGLAVRILTNKKVSPQLALNIMEQGITNTTEIRNILEDKTQEKIQLIDTAAATKKRKKIANKIINSCFKKIDAGDIQTAKKDINFFKQIIKELEEKIQQAEDEKSKSNNLKIPI